MLFMDTEQKTSTEEQDNDCLQEMDGRFMRRRWQPLVIPLITVIFCLVLGYFLDSEAIKLLGIILVVILLLILS